MSQEYLSVNNLSFEYPDGFKALENINLSLSKGERLAVLGPNGAGKTPLILHLNGILGDLNGDRLLHVLTSEKGEVTDDFDAHTCIFINTSYHLILS